MHAVNIKVSDLIVIFAVIDKRSSLFFYLIGLISCKNTLPMWKVLSHMTVILAWSLIELLANVFAIDKRASLLMSAVKL